MALRVAAGPTRHARLGLIAAAVLVAFAGTDLVEIRSGAWYWPWWLLLDNGLCLVALLGCWVYYGRVVGARGHSPGATTGRP
ncbi:MAG: hypothetical protein DWQ31_14645 [Planctomycetota bacterium]|nr:MAG: hypothetical protein DWQ31_14645 [Planctomycetota bacterium]REJ96092.1 MAG: hypothetical protein DWQ35_05115 [Planctomycetota bacterium]REK21864.1 MAG: hypothetical protein DWQ42_18445 [Planctomycetota bacterium]REK46672.1 MAG: hypothetical protein DWQ46_06130 [Planctomycetota bacterium]